VTKNRKLQKLTISLLKEGLSRADALKNADTVSGYRVPSISTGHDSLFTASRVPSPPPWRAYLRDHVDGGLDDLLTASASGVLLLEVSDRLFAVTFGHGRHLLDTEAFEYDFGLKVVLNTVVPDQLKSVDAKTIDDTSVHTRRDVSRDSALSTFGLDLSHDLLRAVTGTPDDGTLAHRLTGSDALGIQTRAQVPDLPDLIARLYEHYRSDVYKENFDFIDHLRPERNAKRVRELEALLLASLESWELDDVHLAAPETLDWLDLAGFRLTSVRDQDELDSDPRISTYLQSREGHELTKALLKLDKLIAVSESTGEVMERWSVYRCLVYQVELDGQLYVLSAGDWFRVDLSYQHQVEAEVNALPRFAGLPDADAGTDEDTYNKKAALELGALCLNKKLIQDAGPDSMEICDILTLAGGLIHVKQRGSSSTLSHLFAQGVNSGERLLLDDTFRSKAHAVISTLDPEFGDVLPLDRPSDPGAHEVTFAVITRSKRSTPLTLPFFSVVSLRTAARTLQAYGFKVSVATVEER
jgi:uncharacterized protein (TIGR04141 family)